MYQLTAKWPCHLPFYGEIALSSSDPRMLRDWCVSLTNLFLHKGDYLRPSASTTSPSHSAVPFAFRQLLFAMPPRKAASKSSVSSLCPAISRLTHFPLQLSCQGCPLFPAFFSSRHKVRALLFSRFCPTYPTTCRSKRKPVSASADSDV
jgi:hypothetical protein